MRQIIIAQCHHDVAIYFVYFSEKDGINIQFQINLTKITTKS